MIELRNIKKSYNIGSEEILILKGIDLTIQDGEFVSIM
jgi:putative ABC transport system ATP-binding protein